MFYRIHYKDTTLGLAFIIVFFPVYLLLLVIKMGLKLIVDIAKWLVSSVHKLMIMDLQICGYHIENDD